MLAVRIVIARYLGDEPQPGLVECWLDDAHGRRWVFVEKTAVVSSEHLDAHVAYPREGVIAGEVVEHRRDPDGREVVRFDTTRPWGVASVDGETRFDLPSDRLIEI